MSATPRSPAVTFDLTAASISRPAFISMMAMLMALNALAIDIVLPAFGALQQAYADVDVSRVQLVLTAYVLGFAIAQLVLGPLSDRFGRRMPLFIGMAGYILFACAGGLAPDFNLLLLSRFLQGTCAAATRVVALAMVRDTHSGRAMASTMSLVMMVFMVVPVFAPMIGQGIIVFSDWHFIFFAMAAMCGAVLLWCMVAMPETLPPEGRRPLTFRSVAAAFALIATDRHALFYALANAFFFASLFGFLNLAQPLLAEVYGLGALFPFAFGSVAVLMAVTSLTNSRLVGALGQRRLSHGALIGFASLSALLATIAAFGNPPLWLFLGLLALTMPLFGLIGANLNSLAMEPLGSIAGTASSVLGFLQTGGGGLFGAIIGMFYAGQVVTLAVGFTLASATALACVFIAERGQLFGTGEADG